MEEDRPDQIGGGEHVFRHQPPRPVVPPVAAQPYARISAERRAGRAGGGHSSGTRAPAAGRSNSPPPPPHAAGPPLPGPPPLSAVETRPFSADTPLLAR